MGVSFGRSRVADLTFQVFGRTIHPDWFIGRAHKRFALGDWEADVRIVEGGHVLHWKSGKVRMTEVLIGAETTLPEPGLLFHSAVRHERSTTIQQANYCEYQTCFEVERVPAEIFARLCDELVLDPSRDRLFHQFRQTNRLAPAPISAARVESRSNGFLVHTFHTFPEERAIVRTHSLFETLQHAIR